MKKPKVYWGQYLGLRECPYARRWVLDAVVCSVRVHHFYRSDDPRYKHDHPWWYLTIVLKGYYYDVGEGDTRLVLPLRPQFRRALRPHYVQPGDNGCWSLVFTGRARRPWGFWVKGKFKKAHRFFFDYGHPPCE